MYLFSTEVFSMVAMAIKGQPFCVGDLKKELNEKCRKQTTKKGKYLDDTVTMYHKEDVWEFILSHESGRNFLEKNRINSINGLLYWNSVKNLNHTSNNNPQNLSAENEYHGFDDNGE